MKCLRSFLALGVVLTVHQTTCRGYYSDYSNGDLTVAKNYRVICGNGQQRHFDGYTLKHIRVTSTVKLSSLPSDIFTSRLRFNPRDWRKRAKYRYPTRLQFEILKPATKTIIRNFHVKVEGAREVTVEYSNDGKRWYWAATVVSDNYIHKTEGALFEFEYLTDSFCDWEKYNCNGVRATFLRVTFRNPRYSSKVPELYGASIDACFITNDGHPPPECLQDRWGYYYVGTANHTQGGKPCKPWKNIKYANGRKYYEYFPVEFSDGTMKKAGDYCRTQGIRESPGCHTSNDYRDWDSCDVPHC